MNLPLPKLNIAPAAIPSPTHCTKAVVYLLLGKRCLWAKEPG